MKRIKFTIISTCFILITHSSVAQQETRVSLQALKNYNDISAVMNEAFPENEFKTYNRNSFSEPQLTTYLSQHFKRLDLLPIIDNQHKIFKLDSYYHSGNWFRAIGFPRESIKSYNAFFKYYKFIENTLSEAEAQDYLTRRSVGYSVLAENYAKIGSLDSAAIIHKINIKFAKTHNDVLYASAINNYGLFFYWTKKELDSALIYFNKAYAIATFKFPKHTLTGSIRDNIADVYTDQQHYKKALPLYEANFEFYKHTIGEGLKNRDFPRLISAGAQLIETNLQLNNIEEANNQFQHLEAIINDKSSNGAYPASSMLEFLIVKEHLLAKQQKIEDAYKAVKHVKRFSDSLQQIENKVNTIWQEELNTISVDRVALNFKIGRIQKENKIKT